MIPGNPVVLTGRVVRPPRRLTRPDGSEVVQFSFEPDGNREGRAPAARERVDVLVFGPAAGQGIDQLQGGETLRVEGRLRQRTWETPEGRHRSRTEIVATELHRLSGDGSSVLTPSLQSTFENRIEKALTPRPSLSGQRPETCSDFKRGE